MNMQKQPRQQSEYVTNLKEELEALNATSFVNAVKLVDKEIQRAEKNVNNEFVNILEPKPIKLQQKIKIPKDEYPSVNFVGKLLGPGGRTLRQLQDETGCKMAILGRGSVRDKNKEEELRKQGGKYAHLNDELHLNIEAMGSPNVAFDVMSAALVLVAQYMQPEFQDEAQMSEMGFMNNGQQARGGGRGGPRGGGRGAPRGAPGVRGGPGGRGAPGARGAMGARGGGMAMRGGRGAMSVRGGAMPMRGGAGGFGRGAPVPVPQPAPVPAYDYSEDYSASGGYGDMGYGDQSAGSSGRSGGYGEMGYGDQSAGMGGGGAEAQYYDYGHGGQAQAPQDLMSLGSGSMGGGMGGGMPRGGGRGAAAGGPMRGMGRAAGARVGASPYAQRARGRGAMRGAPVY